MGNRRPVLAALAAGALLLSGLVPGVADASSSPPGLVVFSSGFILVDPDLENPSQVFSVKPDGSGLRQLTHVPDGQQAGSPDLSRDRKRIAYVSNADGNFAVWVMKADGRHQHRLLGREGFDFFEPRWSPDRTHLVVTRCDMTLGFRSRCEIVRTRSDGSHGRVLVGGNRISANPSYSPDGTWVAFSSDLGGYVSAVWKVRSTGGKPVRLTRANLEAFWPNWSPDGKRLVFTDNCCRPASNVYTMRSDGSHVRKLTHQSGGGGPSFASYSPDGRKIVYTSDQLRGPDYATTDVFVMNANGSGQHRLVEGQPQGVGPDWERSR